jgi:hypothetical protein
MGSQRGSYERGGTISRRPCSLAGRGGLLLFQQLQAPKTSLGCSRRGRQC